MNIKVIIIAVVTVLAGALVVTWAGDSTTDEETTETNTSPTSVEVVDFSSGTSIESITVFGQVVSVTEVDVYPEMQGVVQSVRQSLGNRVATGETVVVLDNSSQSQELARAQAGLASAQANLQKLKNGATATEIANLTLALETAQVNLEQAETSLDSYLNTVRDGVAGSLQDTLDPSFFHNGTKRTADLRILADPITDKYPLNDMRIALQNDLSSVESADDARDLLADYEELVDDLMNHVSSLKDGQMSPSNKDAYLATLRGIANTIDTWQTTLASRRAAVSNARVSLETARNNLADAQDGADAQDLISAQAQVNQAQAQVRSAEIALGKTVVRAPVVGNISALDARVGMLVGPSTALFTIANEETLRIDSKLSPSAARRVSVGDRVLVDGTYNGRVSVVSPSVDAATGQVDIQVLLQSGQGEVVSGTGVRLEIFPDVPASSARTLTVPISAIFVRDEQSYVYVIRDGRAVPVAVETNSLFGESIEIQSGISSSDQVITNARSVDDDELVTPRNS